MPINISNTWWLAKRQMRDTATSYLFSAVYFAFMGLVLGADWNWGVQIALPILMFILIQPAVSPRYMTWKKDNEVVRHQIFLHSLPVGFTNIVLARLIAMLVAGLINIPLFFLPFWFLNSDWNSFGHFAVWVAFWSGLALAGAGFAILQEFWMSVRDWTKLNFVAVILVMGAAAITLPLTGLDTVQMAADHPWIMAIGPLSFGIATLWWCCGQAVVGFRKREFAS